jgi:uroporphyrinogen decarboxylase
MSPKSLLEVLHGRVPERRPMWFMRQAGRYLPEYRALRARVGSFLELCYDCELAAQITLQPLNRYDLDAAIVFADILLIAHAMGLPLEFVEGVGPVLGTVRSRDDVAALRSGRSSGLLKHVGDTLAKVRAALPAQAALIGFCGGPWTVASYMIEGGTSAGRERSRCAAIENPSWFADLIDQLVEESIDYLRLQVEAGADAVQIFESWAGDIPYQLHERIIFIPLRRICVGVRDRYPDIPLILFGRGLGSAHPVLGSMTSANAIGVEQGVDLSWVSRELPAKCAVQGNLDPLMLVVGGEPLDRGVDAILASAAMERHIFNLGHGIRPDTDPAMVTRVIERVRAFDGAARG